jgi:aryl-alcohol dehydrogenase-like predicted oxidoreductase
LRKRTLGRSGVQVSAVGLGCNALGGRIDPEASRKVIHKALDIGVTLFDTAANYGHHYGSPGGSENCLGQFLGDRRKDIVLATKFGNPVLQRKDGAPEGASRRHIMLAVETSLKRLQTDWIDLYQLHRPDPLTPIEETLRALDDLIRQGKIRYIGCSNFPGWQAVEAHWTAKHSGLNAFITCQSEYSLLARDIERDLIPALQQYGLGLLPYYPLAAGLLTGKYSRHAPSPAGARLTQTQRLADRYLTAANWTVVERLEQFCAGRNRSLLELAFAWLLAQPAVASVIAGATRPEQLELNVRAIDWVLTAEELAEIDRLFFAKQRDTRAFVTPAQAGVQDS